MAPVETDRWSGSGSGSYSQHELARVRENRELDRRGLRTSPFDVVSSLLLASILFTSAFVLLSFLIWLTQGTNESVVSSPPVQYGSKGSESSEGSESEFEKP